MSEPQFRAGLIACVRELDETGHNRGTSGDVSTRLGKAILITPSGVPSKQLKPDMLADSQPRHDQRHILSDVELAETANGITSYGPQSGTTHVTMPLRLLV